MLIDELQRKALDLGIPLSLQLDLTWRCNENCVHCYLEHGDHGELSTAEIKDLLGQAAAAGTLFLSLSGGEPLLRPDFFDVVAYARKLLFSVKLKTNAIGIGPDEARRLKDLGVSEVQISIYSHRPEIHDAITRVPGSLARSLEAIRLLRSHRVRVLVANVLLRQNSSDYARVRQLADELGAQYTVDPTITPKLDGNVSPLSFRVTPETLSTVFQDPTLLGRSEDFCAPPDTNADLEGYPCSAGHTACYVSPFGDVLPCVQFPMPCGNIRRQRLAEIWKHSPNFLKLRAVRERDLPVCFACVHASICTRCPGLAYMEGDLTGPSSADCEKLYIRTGVAPAVPGSSKLIVFKGFRPAPQAK